MKWFFNNQEVEKTEWSWEVEYNDKRVLKQYDDNGVYHQTKEIDIDNVKIFRVSNDNQSISFLIEKGEKPFFLIRNFLLENGLIKERVFVFGIEGKVYVSAIGNKLIVSTKDN